MKAEPLKSSRFIIFFTIVLVGFAVLYGRFFHIQIVRGNDFSRQFKNQCRQDIPIKARRGTIYDCNGNVLAYSVEVENFYISTDSLQLLDEVADRVAPLLGKSKRGLRGFLRKRAGRRTYLVKKCDPELCDKIRILNINAIKSETDFVRLYPYGSTAADLLGYVNHDHYAKAGAELYCDRYLSGIDGVRSYLRDGRGGLYPLTSQPEIPAVDGEDVYLTIDIEYQQILEEEVRAAVEKWDALAGTAVLIDPESGRILAMCNVQPNHPVEHTRIPKVSAICDLFEPGSTFKTIVFGALLEEDLIDLEDTIWAGHGEFRFNNIRVRDDKELDTITQAEAFILSSNVATGRLALRLGPKKLFRYACEFGFGLSSGLEFTGEPSGRLHEPEVWSEYYCAMLSIGHEVSASALQMARVFGVVASDGIMMKPMLVEKVVSRHGSAIKKFYPEIQKRIFSPEATAQLQDLCELVVDTGTAHYALTDGITFAGKTGTAEKPDPEGGYDKSRYMASFGGYFPRENPRFAAIVVIDEPEKINYGGITAGPAFARAAKRIVELEQRRNQPSLEFATPPEEIFRDSGNSLFNKEIDSRTDKPEGITHTSRSISINAELDSNAVFLPNLRGLSARKAVQKVIELGLTCSIEGSGDVIESLPEGNSYISRDESIRLICKLKDGEVRH